MQAELVAGALKRVTNRSQLTLLTAKAIPEFDRRNARTAGTDVLLRFRPRKPLVVAQKERQRKPLRIFGTFRGLAALLLCAGFLAAPVVSRGAELKQKTLSSWNAYVQAANARLKSGKSPLFRVDDEGPDDLRLLRQGEILVSQVGRQNPKPIPSALIHDWTRTAFIPDTTADEVLSTVRDYGDYKGFYKPTVLDSTLLATDGSCDAYSLRVADEERLAHVAFDTKNQTCYFRVDQQRWYSVTYTTQVREIRNYGTANQQELPPDQGNGYIWRLHSVAQFEQKDGGVYVEVEAIALSRNIPVAVRWLVDPIVRHISRNSLFLSLQQTGEAVHSTMAAKREGRPALSTRELSSVEAGSKP